MALTEYEKESIRHRVDRSCTNALKWEARDYMRRMKYLRKNEISLEEAPIQEFQGLGYYDDYDLTGVQFEVQGHDIIVQNEKLALALSALTPEQRSLILLSYYLDMNDNEIGKQMKMVRRSVQYRRLKILKELEWRMEYERSDGEDD